MRVQIDPAVLRKTKWHEYAIRFIFGGTVTATAGIIAKCFGPIVAGLFLACPAIFPASATLVEKHEEEKKQRLGLSGTKRGMDAAGIDAVGSAIGSIGLLAFAAVFWRLSTRHSFWLVLTIATLAWMSASFLLWHFRKTWPYLKSRL